MKRIAITQRCDAIPGRQETRDALDVRLSKLLWEWGFLPLPLSSGVTEHRAYLEALAPDGFLLSGGNDINSVTERDALESACLTYAELHQLPVVGICRGLQMISHHLGGSQRYIPDHVAITHRIIGPLVGSGERQVNSYHSNGLLASDLGSNLEAMAWADDGTIEALRHKHLPWLGIMWHPERDIPTAFADRQLISSFLNLGTLS